MSQTAQLTERKPGRWGDAMPPTRSLLRWVYVGRLSVASVVFVAAAFFFTAVSPGVLVTVAVAVILSLVVTAASVLHTHVRGATPSIAFLYAQFLFDLCLVTTVVHVTGGASSDFASLYILVIAVTAVTMPFPPTMLVTAVAALLYVGDSVWGHPVPLTVSLWLQIALFLFVALVMGWVASRVRVEGDQRKALEREVTRLRLEAGDILRQISGGVVTVDGDGYLVFANESAERLLVFSSDEYVGKAFMPFLSSRSPQLGAAIVMTQNEERRQVRAEGRVSVNGTSFPIGLTTTAHRLEEHGKPSVTAIFTDISDQKRLEELHLRTERLEAVAALSASLAHEIRNPLASIRSSVEQIGHSVRADPDDRFLADLVIRESDRLSRLLSEFLDFSRVRMTEANNLDLNAVARMAVDLVREHPACPDSAQIAVQEGSTCIKGDEDLLHRIVVNLVLNAMQASSGTAHVHVGIREIELGDLPGGISREMAVLLTVSDNGPGIPEFIRERLFDPFVTGREGGSGLGLAIVQRAVEAHGGLVFVDSEVGVGTTFSVFLPAQGAEEVAA
jgi:two-component system, NtrC family, sensor histidine kinase PilS